MTNDVEIKDVELVGDDLPQTDGISELQQINNGQVESKFNSALAEVMEACRETGKKGTVTIVLEIEPQPRFGEHAIALSGDVKKKIPQQKLPSNMRYVGPHGQIMVNDPAQPSLPSTPSMIQTGFQTVTEADPDFQPVN